MTTLRQATVSRTTRETDITVKLVLDGSGRAAVKTGVPFMDHMLTAFAKHGFFDLEVRATGDLEIDAHHTLEDLGLVLGQALREAVGDKAGIRRFGTAFVPMDEALARVVLDLSGRPYLGFRVPRPGGLPVGGVDPRLFREFFQALVNTAGLTLHLDLLAGEEMHHIFEAAFKAFGRALDQAVAAEPRCPGIPSTKGAL
ncbi:MAG: imidazoleglycerol-phosphate dehydratase HisB [Lentisphaeria bacterium]|jgi:imidazoleglycerol-phosphate dehydratase